MLRLAILLACAAAALAGIAEDVGIVPDIIDTAPCEILKVTFKGGLCVNLGNHLTPSQVAELPKFSWPAYNDAYYTLVFVDPDAPSRADPEYRSYLHYLIGNVPGNDVSAGTALASFTGSAPPKGSGPHRYTFLVYKQPKKIDFRMTPITCSKSDDRNNFTVREFVQAHELGDPVAWNFYYSEFQNEGLASLHKRAHISVFISA